MKRFFRLIFTTALVFLLFSCLENTDARTISVSGSGAVQVIPDRAVLELSVVTWNPSVSVASNENAALMTKVQKALESAGVPKDSYSTSNYSIRREVSYVNGRSVPGDYRASNVLNVVLTDITGVGEVIDAAISADRRSQVGTGDRSERIRTYNFPQGRVTDHRVGLTLHRIDAILDGDLDEIMDTIITTDQMEKLKAENPDA